MNNAEATAPQIIDFATPEAQLLKAISTKACDLAAEAGLDVSDPAVVAEVTRAAIRFAVETEPVVRKALASLVWDAVNR